MICKLFFLTILMCVSLSGSVSIGTHSDHRLSARTTGRFKDFVTKIWSIFKKKPKTPKNEEQEIKDDEQQTEELAAWCKNIDEAWLPSSSLQTNVPTMTRAFEQAQQLLKQPSKGEQKEMKISAAQKLALAMYTKNGDEVINPIIKSGYNPPDDGALGIGAAPEIIQKGSEAAQKYVRFFVEALAVLQRDQKEQPKSLFRGTRRTQAEINSLNQKKFEIWKAISSTSADEKVALNFAVTLKFGGPAGGGEREFLPPSSDLLPVIFEITNQPSATFLQELSHFQGEQEWVLRPNQKFNLVTVKDYEFMSGQNKIKGYKLVGTVEQN